MTLGLVADVALDAGEVGLLMGLNEKGQVSEKPALQKIAGNQTSGVVLRRP